ncbi:MAG: cytochrome c biogenesis protein ResB [Bowdeniella nasicola]|nr:cytochrome c biogenesis protein ResB [Bowdeniella nasicola]
MGELTTWLRWAWRQLTSMRVAIFLLLTLAVAATPGSVFPQRSAEPERVQAYLVEHPTLGPLLDKAGFFSVYSSPWFSAVYILLFISLIGCIVPRTRDLVRALRRPPVRVPSRLLRFPVSREFAHPARVAHSDDDAPTRLDDTSARDHFAADLDALAERARGRYRVTRTAEGVSAERGYLKEAGNLAFHIGLVFVLISFAWGQLATYRGQAIVVEGRGFANALVDYDSFQSGAWFDDADLAPFSFTLEHFSSSFAPSGRPESFVAEVRVREDGPDGAIIERPAAITPNHPLVAADAAITLSGNGYAPLVRVTDADGALAFEGTVPFIPEDATYTSAGVIKVPDVSAGLDQLGFTGVFMPTAGWQDGAFVSAHPELLDPLLVLDLWRGDLALDDGVPRNAYELQTEQLEQVRDTEGAPVSLQLHPGESVDLPDGLGHLEFVSLERFASFDVRHDPSLTALLVSTLLSVGGMCLSLFLPRRRLFARALVRDGVPVLQVAALARGDDGGLAPELDWWCEALEAASAT